MGFVTLGVTNSVKRQQLDPFSVIIDHCSVGWVSTGLDPESTQSETETTVACGCTNTNQIEVGINQDELTVAPPWNKLELVQIGKRYLCVAAHRCIRTLRVAQNEHAAPQLYTTLHRRRCSSMSAPRITTHYTIHPRDKDSRWEGKAAHLLKTLSVFLIPFVASVVTRWLHEQSTFWDWSVNSVMGFVSQTGTVCIGGKLVFYFRSL